MSVGLTALVLALGGDAVPVAIRVNYEAPSECPNAAAFYDAVSARTEHVRPAVGEEPRMDVTVRVTRDGRTYTGEVREVVNGRESAVRPIDGSVCKDVVEALSLTVALSIDPNAHAPAPKPASAQAVSPPPRASQDPVENRPDRPCETPREAPPDNPSDRAADNPSEEHRGPTVANADSGASALRLEVGLGVVGTSIDTSGFSLGGGLFATVLRESSQGAGTSSSVQLGLVFAGTGLLSTPPDHRSRFGALLLDACPWRPRVGELTLAPCALGALGVLEVSGSDVSDAKTVDRAWFSAGLDAELSWPLGEGWAFEGALGATAPLVRRRYFTSDAEHVVAQTPVISPLARLGVGFRF